MENIKFETGIKRFAINDDETRVLEFNPSDPGFLSKADVIIDKLNAAIESVENQNVKIDVNGTNLDDIRKSALAVRTAENAIRECIDEWFYEGASYIIFGRVSPLATFNGMTNAENFIHAVSEIIKPYIAEEAKKSSERVKKYKDAYAGDSSQMS